MTFQHTLTKAGAALALLATAVASQAYVVTIAPSGSPLGCATPNTVALIDCSTFQADTVQGKLGSQLTISNYQDPSLGGSLVATYSEQGQIALTTFSLNSSTTKIGGASFNVWATFKLDGGGIWSTDLTGDTIFTATSAVLSNAALYGSWGGNPAVKLADLALLPANLAAVANVTDKSTNLSTSFQIIPVAGSTGVGGFFQAPAVWDVDLFANNVGFGAGTGVVTPDPLVDGSPVFFTTNNYATTPVEQGGSGSFNGAFVTRVPEPGMLSLVGLALFGVGVSAKRKAARKS